MIVWEGGGTHGAEGGHGAERPNLGDKDLCRDCKKTSPEAIPDANVAGRTRGRARSKNADYPLPFARMFLSFAPAGMGFEYDLLKQAAPEATGYPVFEMDLAFLESQLRAMEAPKAHIDCLHFE